MTGPELRALRLRLGYSLTALALYTGTAVSTICRYQSGELEIPEVYERLMHLLRPRKRSTMTEMEARKFLPK